MENFFVLVTGTVAILTFLFPVTLLLVVMWIWTFVAQARRHDEPGWLFGCGCLPSLATPVALLLCGTVFAYNPTRTEPPRSYPVYIIWVLLLAHTPLAVLHTRTMREADRLVAAASWVLTGFVSLCAAFVSMMCVTGVWL